MSYNSEEKDATEPTKVNPFPWFPWWPEVEQSHLLPIILLGVIGATLLAYWIF